MQHHEFLEQLVDDLSAATPDMLHIERSEGETAVRFREFDIVYSYDEANKAEYLWVIFLSVDMFMVAAQETWGFCFQDETVAPFNTYVTFRRKKEYGQPVFPPPTKELENLARQLCRIVLNKISK